ncbi:beta-ketoacyl synthase domain-containing protein [Lindgomyces ingoldianus]|uniref:Beta-ketoacyl synthase domain-containing protein n=1 Tax=Lindgomyces ingoldianus TaxID=673940 RepID=A0ACB6QKJ2_9PLEO|nr:beta-ketoacyl synthase domain-containing protein [Lindgomyces ingoldianus]KAF2466642.1 beta-ketoacyl synthase domain-containing protein [Lindgomyces ingoldianus]
MFVPPPSEPIAVVGSSCRFAGGATSPSKFWELLSAPPDLSREVPTTRFNPHAFYHPDGEYHGTTNSIKAYWLEQDHREFDAAFFNITPREAEALDPQQRMTLEVVYEALESAGYTLDRYFGQNVGVFAGLMTADYDTLSGRDELTASQYYATGNARSLISNRVSYFFNFRGPSMTIDTACSSSLVALHQAVHSLRSRESVMACVTGANLLLTPEQFIVEASLHMLSPTGKCRMWDISADGYARGEGVAAIFLKPLSRALADGDEIEAVIRQTGVNSDGRTPGITLPNPAAQANLIKDTYLRAGLDLRNAADRCQYFEAHGTGTQAGDPREASAIYEAFFEPIASSPPEGSGVAKGFDVTTESRAFGGSREPEGPGKLLVGSVKTAIGHTEGAAGLAGLLKVIQAMKHGKVPPNLHMHTLNPNVSPFSKNLRIPTTLESWPQVPTGQPLRASVNSFGFGGTNAHAIVELFDSQIHAKHILTISEDRADTPTKKKESSRPVPLLLSANSRRSLRSSIELLKDFILKNSHINCNRLALKLSSRTCFPYRLSLPVTTTPGMIKALDDVLSISTDQLGFRAAGVQGQPRILAVFTGQGAQWPKMSSTLFLSNEVYRSSIRKLDQILKACRDPPQWSLEEQIFAEKGMSRVHEAAVSQPLCTALQIGLVDLLRSLEVLFHSVVGHSSGEIGAAYAAGRLSAKDAILISYYRGEVAHLAEGTNSEKGAMLAVGLSSDEADEFCKAPQFEGKLFVAANNSPSSVTLSGDTESIDAASSALVKSGKFARRLLVDTAYHSPHMTKPAAAYIEALRRCGIKSLPGRSDVRWSSSVEGYGEMLNQSVAMEYWRDNMTNSVRFRDALESALAKHGPFDCVVEIGPHPALKGPSIQTMKPTISPVPPYIGFLDRNKDDSVAFAESIGSIWCTSGPHAINIPKYIQSSPKDDLSRCKISDMPSYPWDHSQIHYRETRISRQYHSRSDPPHELLGVRTRDDNEHNLRWRNILKVDKVPWLNHHKFQGQALVPASAYCIMALDAARVHLKAGKQFATSVQLLNLTIESGINLEPNSQGTEILFSLQIMPHRPSDPEIEASFTLTSCPADGTTTPKMNMHGNMRMVLGEPMLGLLPPRQTENSETLPADTKAFYRMMDETGLVYSGPFRSLQTIDRRLNYAATTLKRYHSEDTTQLSVSPATLDSCFQSAFLSYAFAGDKSLWTPFLPVSIQSLTFNLAYCNQPKPITDELLRVDSYCTHIGNPSLTSKAIITVDIGIANEQGDTEIQVEGLVVAAFANTRPEDDHELYLHSVLDVDPEDEIVQSYNGEDSGYDPSFIEECARVTNFILRKNNKAIPFKLALPSVARTPFIFLHHDGWASDDENSLQSLMFDSDYSSSLELISAVGKTRSELLLELLPHVIASGHSMHHFNEHVGRVIQQISHKYPQIQVLDMSDPESGLTKQILRNPRLHLGGFTVANFTPSVTSPRDIDKLNMRRSYVTTVDVDLNKDLIEQTPPAVSFDLVLLSASILQSKSTGKIMREIRSIMKTGGFLLLLDSPNIVLTDRLHGLPTAFPSELPTPSEWPDVLENCNFGQVARYSNQVFPSGFSIFVRQAIDPQLAIPHRLLEEESREIVEHLLIIGGTSAYTSSLGNELQELLGSFCHTITLRDSFDTLEAEDIGECTATIIAADLDESVMSNMTEERITQLKDLMRPKMKAMWLTLGARYSNPDHAATFGFTRTIAAEIPNLTVRNLDLERTEGSSLLVAEMFLGMIVDDGVSHWHPDGRSWISEREIFMEDGRRLISRVLPFEPGNSRVNSSRRIVSDSVTSANTALTVKQNGKQVTLETAALENLPPRDVNGNISTIQVSYSSLNLVPITDNYAAYICIGNDMTTGNLVVAPSAANSSYISMPSTRVYSLKAETRPLDLLNSVTRFAIAATIARKARGRSLVLIEPDTYTLHAIQQIYEARISIVRTSANDEAPNLGVRTLGIHPRTPISRIKALLSSFNALVVSFLPENDDFSQKIRHCFPEACQFLPPPVLSDSNTNIGDGGFSSARLSWVGAISAALDGLDNTAPRSFHTNTISVPSLLETRHPFPLFTIIDWKAERMVSRIVSPLVSHRMLRPDRTYILVGLTRDMGQSLSRFFIDLGAKHIVLASRNPNMHPKWKDELVSTHGVEIAIEKLDVTDIVNVRRFKAKLSQSMPPVAGVVNGAMVLDDRVFAQMTLKTWNRVLHPKTIGSKNLDSVFSDPEMEFFIMTSSFAAIGGHPGQSNYAAANMYMNGLAANRRAHGVAGSVLNIGVIYGLGFLLREKQNLYAGLEREGYPPISERDLHHMFHEAILAGRPNVPDQPLDLTTGLSRYRADSPDLLFWQMDPRFCHFTKHNGTQDSAEATKAQQSLKDQIANLESAPKIADVVSAFFVEKLETLLVLPGGSVSREQNMTDLGVDSLIVVELRNWFYKMIERDVPALKILGARSIHRLCLDIAEQINASCPSTDSAN